MSLNKVKLVKYVNPHLFWIREEDDVINLETIEKRLNRDLKIAPQLRADANELVALLDVDQLRRGIIIEAKDGYNCWLLDYGKTVFTHHVHKLPKDLAAILPTIKPASLNDIVGVHHRLNVDTCKEDIEIRPYFDSHAIRYVEAKLSQAKNVYFCKERRTEGIFCGSLILEMWDGVKINLADLLVLEELAVVNKELFLEALAENASKIPITVLCQDGVFDDRNLCSVEGLGRGTYRMKVISTKEHQVDTWLETVNITLPHLNVEDRVKEQEILLNHSDESESTFSDCSHISNTTFSMDTSFSGSCIGPITRVHQGLARLLNRECKNSLENENEGTIKDVKTSNKTESKLLITGGKKCLKSSDVIKLVPDIDITKSAENINELLHCKVPTNSNELARTRKVMKKSELLKVLSNLENRIPNSTRNISEISSSIDSTSISSDHSNEVLVGNGNILTGVVMTNSFPCKCENCQKVFEDDLLEETPKAFTDEIKFNDQFYKGKPQPLIKVNSSKSDTIMVRKHDKNQTKIEKDMAPNFLIHCPGHLPTPASEIYHVPFCIPVHNALRTMKYKIPRSIQMYMWPALMRSMNACIVNEKSSGKTVCYLPALCSFLIQKDSRYPFLPREPSPIAVILCHNIKKAEEVYDLLRTFLTHTLKKVHTFLLVPPMEEMLMAQLKNAEIIVSTPKIFVRILSSRVINLKKLCHLVIEDVDNILNQTSIEMHKIVKAIQTMLDHRIFVNSVQTIMTSEKWTIPLEDFIRCLETPPVISIGSHLESVIYGKANIEMHFVKKEDKRKHITDILKENSKDLKTMIICNTEDEVLEASEHFQILGISVITATRSMVREEIEEKETLWLSTPLKNNSAFICTDYVLHTQLSITTAQVLIHYSLPSDSWSLFTRRFKCVVDTHDSPFNAKFNRTNAVKVHIFVDESCNKQFPRLYYFLQQMKTTLPQHFKSFCENLENAEESIKIEDKKPICKRLKLLGECTKFRCKKRHVFSKHVDTDEDIPSSGIIKFKVLHIADVTQYGIKILSHWNIKHEKQNLNNYTNLVTTILKKCLYTNRTMAIDVKVGCLYVYFDAKEVTYHRCKVLKIFTRERITNTAHEIKIKLIDDGMEKRTFASLLFELPHEYFDIPPQSIEARLANIVPLENDTEWNIRTKCKVEKVIRDLIEKYPEAYFVGKIVLQIGGTVWLEDLIMREDVISLNESVTLLTLKKKLINLDLVEVDQSPLSNLRDVYVKSGLELPNYEMESKPKSKTKRLTQIQPQWAFFDTQVDLYNIVYFSCSESPQKFYVKLEKFYDMYMNLEEEIQNALQKPFYPAIEEVVLENCYLAKDPDGHYYNRVMLKAVKGDMAECFFVDFGNTADIPIDELMYLSDEHISKLPFQVIECELYGIKPVLDSWSSEAANVFYKFCYLPNTDIFRNLFVNVISSEPCHDGPNKYTVAVLDYYEGKKTLINKILVDCGLAIDDDNARLEDLVLPEVNFDSKEADDENKIEIPSNFTFKEVMETLSNECELSQNIEQLSEDVDRSSFENDGWDFACWDLKAFMNDLTRNNPAVEIRQSTSDSSSKRQFIPIKAATSTDYYAPNILWYQTKAQVIMEIHLQQVEKYSALILRKKMFLFNTKLNDKDYILNLPLLEKVSHIEKCNTGRLVKITLTKVKEQEWSKLVDSKEKMRNIKYDLSKIEVDEPVKRRFLDHKFNQKEEDDNYLTITNISSEEETDSNSDEGDYAR